MTTIEDLKFKIQETKVKYVTPDTEKEELRKVAENKSKIRKKNVEAFKKEYGENPMGRMFRLLSIEGNFTAFEMRDIRSIVKISGPMALYIYLKLSTNRDLGYTNEGEKKDVFANLDEYFFEDGFLCTLRTQRYTAKQLGTSQQNIHNWFKKLESSGAIKRIGHEKVIINNYEEVAPVYSVGELVDVDGFDEESFYLEEGTFDKESCR